MNRIKNVLIVGSLAAITMMVCLFSSTVARSQSSEGEIISKAEKLLAEIKTYDFGQSRVPLTSMSDLLKSVVSRDMEARIEKAMIEFLKSDATFAGKQFVCQQLSIIGTEESVPTLADMLTSDKTSDIALYALQRIPSPAVGQALNNALPRVTGKSKIGIINSLGQRRNSQCVAELEKLIGDSDYLTAQAAVAAMGKIGDENATSAVEKAKSTIQGKLRTDVLEACLKCADNQAKQGNTGRAIAAFRDIYENEKITAVRAAALKGLITTDAVESVDIILASLKGGDAQLQAVAISVIPELPGAADLKPIVAALPNLPALAQIQLLSAFADRNQTSAHQAALDATNDQDEAVRVAALQALAKIGNESDVNLLARIAANSNGKDGEAAQESLNLLKGPAVDRYIISQIPNAESKTKLMLIQSAGQRNIAGAGGTLMSAAADSDPNVRRESLKALAIISQPESMDALLQILIKEKDSGVRSEAERTVVAVAQKIRDENNQAKPVLQILPSVENSEAKISLLQVLGRIGDQNALPELRKELKSANADYQAAAIRSLSSWPNADPKDDLLEMAKTSNNDVNKILAIRGFIDLLKLEKDRPDQELISLYLTAMELATQVNEKRMVLSGIATLRSMQALETAANCLNNADLRPEAEVAVVRISQNVRNGDAGRIAELLNKILASTNNSSLKERIAGMLKKTN